MYTEKSRSQKKRESTALQKIGEELILLPAAVLETLDLPAELLTAILHCQELPPNEARRRQTQFVGKLMRRMENPEELRLAIEEAKAGLQAENMYFHDIERLRDTLIHDDKDRRHEALQNFLHTYPQSDANKLRALIKGALIEADQLQATEKPGHGGGRPKSRALFRWLREAIQ